jgi:cell division protein FtsL|tara:strand:+ start:40858 stop:41214 length:357 start_codon:yes stop_codon:yes gene_type:complete
MSTLLFFWKQRTTLEKLFLVIIAVALVYGSVVTIQKGVYKYKYFKEVEQQYNVAKDSLDALNLRIKDLTQKQQTKTTSTKKQSKAINDKLKQDEAIIDNSNPNDDELNAFISKHEGNR